MSTIKGPKFPFSGQQVSIPEASNQKGLSTNRLENVPPMPTGNLSKALPITKAKGKANVLALRCSKPARKASRNVHLQTVSPNHLRLKDSKGVVSTIPASNYYLQANGETRDFANHLAEKALTRPASEQAIYDQKQTRLHGQYGMSFRVKDASTGHYDKIFTVPVHASPVPISKSHFDMLIQSTGPVMRALRKVMQGVYANENPSAEDLGIESLPQEEQDRILETILESVYFEPKLIDKGMKDYPFLSVAGFDASVGDLDKPTPVFFEYNLGTPSGLSNNIQLLDNLRKTDPELFETFSKQLPTDDSFQILKNCIDSNARAWTKNEDGISVVMGPGVYNGAHPDVAAIAMFSGMPLVNPSDLYEDDNGDIRLETGDKANNPVVTGIYGRMEESYFLQNSEEGIPIRGPDFVDNEKIGKRFGVKLEPGIAYALKYNESGEVVGVRTDKQGRPLLQEVFESIQKPGSFLRAIKNRKLYYSGLGGRVVDDKRIFQAISQYLAPRFKTSDEQIARPPATLDVSQYDKFYNSDRLEGFVVKEPDNSGGVGVHLLVNYGPEQRAEVVKMVRENPSRYIVQEFAQPAVMMCAEEVDGQQKYGSLANDWRLFSMMDADGHVDAGPNSLLLRTAKPNHASTNTSQGGGYGIGLVLSEEEQQTSKRDILPEVKAPSHLGVSRQLDLNYFFTNLNVLTRDAKAGNAKPGAAEVLAQYQRQVMDVLGRDFTPFMSTLNSFAKGSLAQSSLYRALLNFRYQLTHASFESPQIQASIQSNLLSYKPAAEQSRSDKSVNKKKDISSLVRLEEIPVECVREAGPLRILESQKYRKVNHPFIQNVIDTLEKAGGELRLIHQLESDKRSDIIPAAYFRVTKDGSPIIGIDLNQDSAIAGLAHEFTHFEDWRKTGKQPQTPKERYISEKRALAAEMKMEAQDKSVFNSGETRAQSIQDSDYINRICYPMVEGIRDALHQSQWGANSELYKDELASLVDKVLKTACDARSAAVAHYANALAVTDRAFTQVDETSLEAELTMKAFQDRPIFDAIFDSSTLARFKADGTFTKLTEAIRAGLSRFFSSHKSKGSFEYEQQLAAVNRTELIFRENPGQFAQQQ